MGARRSLPMEPTEPYLLDVLAVLAHHRPPSSTLIRPRDEDQRWVGRHMRRVLLFRCEARVVLEDGDGQEGFIAW